MISLVVGLGNIGRKYIGTRHNVGFDTLDRLAERLGASRTNPADWYRWADADVSGRRVLLAWPTTFMNRSGKALVALLDRHRLEPSECLVVVDDFNLPLGTLRFRERGSDGGHNGLASIIDSIGSQDFPRLRLGIGPSAEGGLEPALDRERVVEFVLGTFEAKEQEAARHMIEIAAEAVELAVTHRLGEAMSRYNRAVV